jgi:hypothetical protein
MPFNEKGEFIRANRSIERPLAAKEWPKHLRVQRSGLSCLLGLAALLGILWVVFAFHQWILIGLGAWAATSIQRMLRR